MGKLENTIIETVVGSDIFQKAIDGNLIQFVKSNTFENALDNFVQSENFTTAVNEAIDADLENDFIKNVLTSDDFPSAVHEAIQEDFSGFVDDIVGHSNFPLILDENDIENIVEREVDKRIGAAMDELREEFNEILESIQKRWWHRFI